MLLSDLAGLTRGGLTGGPYRWHGISSVQNRLKQMQDEMQGMLSGFTERQLRQYPAINLWTSEEGVLVSAELPGVNADDLDITVVGRTLTLKGTRKAQEPNETDDCCHRRECRYGTFARAIELPYEVEGAKVSAKFDKGVLTLTLPRAEADKPRKINITSN
ncbi:MAG: Hsp20/alpha crystallin family protein [Nitrospirae bacterium]|nr:Hsp20/alpha crystallin family protein [Nitrospirota bacterium]